MKQWNALLKKEWAAMNGQFYATMVALMLFTILIPFGSNLLNWGLGGLEISIVLSFVWLAVSVLIPTIMLLISLGKEMNRPDIWLHSTVSVFKLFGSKTVFAAFVGFVNILIPVLVLVVESRFFHLWVDIPFKMILGLGGYIFLVLNLFSLLVLCTGLFFGVLYQLIKPVLKGFSGPVVVSLFLFSSWAIARISSSTTYEKMTSIGPRIGPDEDIFNITKGNHFFEVDLAGFQTGAILLDILMAVVLFIAAVVLFEKKVRI